MTQKRGDYGRDMAMLGWIAPVLDGVDVVLGKRATDPRGAGPLRDPPIAGNHTRNLSEKTNPSSHAAGLHNYILLLCIIMYYIIMLTHTGLLS
jgi:hypothetical protein